MSGTELMIDIETLGPAPNAVILSAAGVWFNLDSKDIYNEPLTAAFNEHLNRDLQIASGRELDSDTCTWWMQQDPKAIEMMARGQVTTTTNPADYEKSLRKIGYAIQNANTIWANGPDFDCVLLDQLLKPLGYKWPFWKNRCVRTIKNIYPEAVYRAKQKLADNTSLVAHDALSDCQMQIAIIWEAMRRDQRV